MLLAGYKFMIEMHLRQLVFPYSACGPFIKNKERIEKKKKKKQNTEDILDIFVKIN